jgi:hypothetical protein
MYIPFVIYDRFKKTYGHLFFKPTPILPPIQPSLAQKAKKIIGNNGHQIHDLCSYAVFYAKVGAPAIKNYLLSHKKQLACGIATLASSILFRSWIPFGSIATFLTGAATCAGAHLWVKKHPDVTDAIHTHLAFKVLKEQICDTYFTHQLATEKNIFTRSWIQIQINLSRYILTILEEVKYRLAHAEKKEDNLFDNHFFKYNLHVATAVLRILERTFTEKEKEATQPDNKKLYQTFVWGIQYYSSVLTDMKKRLET